MIHKAEEDYLKLIYEQTVEKNQMLVKNSDLAEAFGYTDQSVNDMIQKLKAKSLVKFIPYRGVLNRKRNERSEGLDSKTIVFGKFFIV